MLHPRMSNLNSRTQLIFGMLFLSLLGFGQTLNNKLGYPENTKLLIIHADDVGMSHSQNAATIEAMEDGYVNSASIMVPCPWFPEIAKYARENSEKDFGLHLTLTSEWLNYKWGPSLVSDQVSSLVNDQGYLYMLVDSLAQFADPIAVRAELENQVELALRAGIDVTHLDAHMFGAMHPKFLKEYISVGRKYQVPVLLTREMVESTGVEISGRDVLMDHLLSASPEDYEDGFDEYYTKMMESLKPGVTCLLIHTAYENEEKVAATEGFVSWGSNWRQQDFDFFTSEKCRKLLEEQGIQLITWREIRDKIVRKD